MGHMVGVSMAEQVVEGTLGITEALKWHLRGNHYPPLPVELVPVAEKAIEMANMIDTGYDEWDIDIDLPAGITFRGKTSITTSEAIESMHLNCFLEVIY